MQYPIPTLRACAEAAIPGCYFAHGEKEEENINLDKIPFDASVVLVEPKMLVVPNLNKFGVRTTVTFQATVSVLASSTINDDPERRLARMDMLLQQALDLLSALEKDDSLQTVKAKTIVSKYNEFDANLDVVVMQLDITPAQRATLC